MKTVLIIPDGTGIRNFLCTRFIDHMLEAGSVVVWHALATAILAPSAGQRRAVLPEAIVPQYEEAFREATTTCRSRLA